MRWRIISGSKHKQVDVQNILIRARLENTIRVPKDRTTNLAVTLARLSTILNDSSDMKMAHGDTDSHPTGLGEVVACKQVKFSLRAKRPL